MWVYKGKEVTPEDIPESAAGFIYEIHEVDTGRSYIGKKLLTKAATRRVKGKVKRIRKTSDWMTYWGSSKQLVDLVAERGEGAFIREILEFTSAKGATNYREAQIQFERDVLGAKLPDGRWKYFNGIINLRISRTAAGIK